MNPILEWLEPYPTDKLSTVCDFLQTTDLTPYIGDNSKRGWNYQFTESVYIPFTRFLRKDNPLDYKTDSEWNTFCELMLPLIEHLQNQLETHKNCKCSLKSAEINILHAGGRILPHCDSHEGAGINPRVHIVLYTNEDAVFTIDGKTHHFPQGSCFVFDNTKLHDVANNSTSLPRAHLVVDFEINGVVDVMVA